MATQVVFLILAALAVCGSGVPMEDTDLKTRRPARDSFQLQAFSNNPAINLNFLHAHEERFWIGKPTSTYCPHPPVSEKQCASYPNNTLIRPHEMAVDVPGGQRVYVAIGGALGFTQAHGGKIPMGGNHKFLHATHSKYTYKRGDWVACPQRGNRGPYLIYAAKRNKHPSNCIDMRIAIVDTGRDAIGAWLYV